MEETLRPHNVESVEYLFPLTLLYNENVSLGGKKYMLSLVRKRALKTIKTEQKETHRPVLGV